MAPIFLTPAAQDSRQSCIISSTYFLRTLNSLILNNLHALRVNAGLKIVHGPPAHAEHLENPREYLAPLTLIGKEFPELHHLLSQLPKTLARGELNLLDTFVHAELTLAFTADMNFVIYNKLRPLRVNTVVKILEYLAPLTLDSERRPELHLLLSQPLKTLARRVLHLLDTFATSASGPSNPAGGAAEGGAGKWDVLSERLRVVAAANNVQKQPKTSPTTFSTSTARKAAVVGRHHQGVGEMEKERSTDNDGDGDANLGRDLADMRGGGLPSPRGTGTCRRRGSATIRPWGGAKEHVRVLGVVHVWRGRPRLHPQIRRSRANVSAPTAARPASKALCSHIDNAHPRASRRTPRGREDAGGLRLARCGRRSAQWSGAASTPKGGETASEYIMNDAPQFAGSFQSPFHPRILLRRRGAGLGLVRTVRGPMRQRSAGAGQGAGLGLGGPGVLLDLAMLDGVAGNLDAVFCEAVRGSVIIGEGTRRAGTPARQSVTSRDGIAISVLDDTDDHRPSFGRRSVFNHHGPPYRLPPPNTTTKKRIGPLSVHQHLRLLPPPPPLWPAGVNRPFTTTTLFRLDHHHHHTFLLTTMSTVHLEPPVCECESLVNRAPLMSFTTAARLAPLVALVGLALVVHRFGRPPRTTSIKRVCRWIRICDLRILTRRLFYAHPPTLHQIRALDPLARVAALAEFPNSYADDGYGAIYFIAVVDDHTLGDFHSGHISTAEFLARVRVKVGEAGHLTSRQRGYRHCDVGQTHFWLFAFYPNKRKAAEKMCHYSFLADAPRAFLECSCGTTHTEYWWLKDLRSFAEVEERARDVLALLGQGDLVRQVVYFLHALGCSDFTDVIYRMFGWSLSGSLMYFDFGRVLVRLMSNCIFRMRIDSAYMDYAREITLDFEMKEADICGPGSTGVGGNLRSTSPWRGGGQCKEMVTLKVDDPVHGCTCGCSRRSTLGCTPGSC
ncbi:hypothetical protein C8F04DRAFT_1183710 [Mycena alexandri]|uniref:Uncharacterized protein n=1 Tax=Mycena alexandri TaxID=1745969 RepID=A0AAD6SY91_9AGAR|nr:hypothetical protein C8F04DRAFT_1183710 [Mycena alexandri]